MPNSKSGKPFVDNLIDQIKQKKSYICIGLDPNFDGKKCIPPYLLKEYNKDHNEAIFQFNKDLVENTIDITPVYKPQIAFYEKYNAHDALKKTIDFIHEKKGLVILDAKRNDIGNTSRAYVENIFNYYDADSTTINGYLGTDCIAPFLEFADRGLFLLVKTSNKSSGEFQDLYTLSKEIYSYLEKELENSPATLQGSILESIISKPEFLSKVKNKEFLVKNYVAMARLVKMWSDQSEQNCKTQYNYTNVGAVIGATYPKQLTELRAEMPNSIFLIPGYGAQGGTADDVVKGFNPDGQGSIINSSRGIDYAYVKEINGRIFKPEEFGEAAKAAAEEMRVDINGALEKQGLI